MSAIHCALVRFIQCSSDLLHAHWANCMFMVVACLRSSIELNFASSLLRIRLIRDRILATEYSYEYTKDFVLVIDCRTSWLFQLEMLETIYGEKILHYRMPRSNFDRYIHSDLVAFMWLYEIDRFRLFLKAFATVFVQECYSYEVDVIDLNCLMFTITDLWLEI